MAKTPRRKFTITNKNTYFSPKTKDLSPPTTQIPPNPMVNLPLQTMTSEKQIAANRANAQKSTGPRSAETKAVTAMNALRHGLTGQVTLMPDEDRTAHDNFCTALVADLAPEGALETQLAQSIAEDHWRMNRGRAVETNMFALGNFGDAPDLGNPQITAAIAAARTFAADPKKFQLLSLYMQRTNRDVQKNFDCLAALQTGRKTRRQQDLEELATLLEYNELKRLPVEKTATQGANGFVFSIHQIHACAARKRALHQARTALSKEDTHRNHTQQRPMRRAA
jgi:hypothetical protein